MEGRRLISAVTVPPLASGKRQTSLTSSQEAPGIGFGVLQRAAPEEGRQLSTAPSQRGQLRGSRSFVRSGCATIRDRRPAVLQRFFRGPRGVRRRGPPGYRPGCSRSNPERFSGARRNQVAHGTGERERSRQPARSWRSGCASTLRSFALRAGAAAAFRRVRRSIRERRCGRFPTGGRRKMTSRADALAQCRAVDRHGGFSILARDGRLGRIPQGERRK